MQDKFKKISQSFALKHDLDPDEFYIFTKTHRIIAGGYEITIYPGFVTDFFSIPGIIKPFYSVVKQYWEPAAAHDAFYARKYPSRQIADIIFYMMLLEAGFESSSTFYYSVRLFGWYTYNRQTSLDDYNHAFCHIEPCSI